MTKLIQVAVLFILLLLSTPSYVYSAPEFAVGLGWPYLGVKCNFSPEFGCEIRYARGKGINVFAPRAYYNFYTSNKLNAFTGAEVGWINFDTLDMKGSGYEAGLFIGGEYFITHKLSLSLDLSPTFINVKSEEFKTDGIEWVVNTGLYYHFSR